MSDLPDVNELAEFLLPYVKMNEDEQEALDYARWVAEDLLEWMTGAERLPRLW